MYIIAYISSLLLLNIISYIYIFIDKFNYAYTIKENSKYLG